MTEADIQNVIEAALLAAGRPLSVVELRELFDEFDRPELAQIDAGVAALAEHYTDRGVELKEVASGWRIQVREAYATLVSRLWAERPAKYSRALLETLALVAYRQPITRGEIEDIRGVAVNPNIIRTLIERDWVRVIGHREVPGRPELLATTKVFLDYFGLRTLDDLPTLAQLKDVESLGVQLEFEAKLPEVAEVQAELVDSGDLEAEDTAADAATSAPAESTPMPAAEAGG
jgi:segregation and condensation protein B